MSGYSDGAEKCGIRVLIAEDNDDLRMAIKLLVDGESDLQCVADTAALADVGALAERYEADVVILDVELQGKSSLRALEYLLARRPQARFLIHSGHAHPELQRQALASGASAYVLKSGNTEELLQAIRAVMSDRRDAARDCATRSTG